MTYTTKEKLEDILGGLPPDTLDEISSELYEVLCKTTMGLLHDSLAGPGISEEQIEAAREFAEEMPETEAAMMLLEFLDSDETKESAIK
jgi:hypothetical protein